jgi:16S rRNA (adenine1518-N6/adenine1519-N6)-dimethyltransferase
MNLQDFKFKKKFGQNFIIDENILNNIVNKSNIEEDSLVIEIGCGSGALTKKLIQSAKYVIGYEIDTSLKPILDNIKSNNLEIIYDDFLKRDILKDIEKYNYKNFYVIANLPYYITTPIISKIIESKLNIKKIVIMVQKEVGDRINAKPNKKEYNSLSIFINYYFDVKKLFDVSRNVFIPKPNVDSIVIELDRKEDKYDVIDENLFFKLVKDSFRQKRKTLKNNLKEYDFDIINEVLGKYKLPATVRAEQLSIDQFIAIANAMSKGENI